MWRRPQRRTKKGEHQQNQQVQNDGEVEMTAVGSPVGTPTKSRKKGVHTNGTRFSSFQTNEGKTYYVPEEGGNAIWTLPDGATVVNF